MRKIALSLIALSLILHAAQAKTHSDKTFLMPRDQITNLAMEYTTWHKRLHKKADAQYNGSIQIVGFYQESTNKAEMGEYFGFNWHHKEGQEIENEIGVSPENQDHTKFNPKLLLDSRFVLHDSGGVFEELGANYSFRPYQEAYGARFEWHQDLDKILDGLFFRITTPLVSVRNHMDLTNIIADKKVDLPFDVNKKINFLDYLSGNVENNAQDPLKHAKINDGSHSATGFADVELQLGYTILQKSKSRIDLSINMLIPTGNTPKSDYIFEPICGNGNHWGVGFGLDYDLTLWERENKSIEFMLVGKYQFLFEGTEKRTLNFKWPFPAPQELSAANYYLLAGEVGHTTLFPLANILTRNLTVRPGSVIDAIAALAFNIGNCTFDIGYNLYFKEEERINLKNHWENDKYAVADIAYNNTDPFDLTFDGFRDKAYGGAAAVDGANVAIQKHNLDLNAVTTPFQVIQKVYAGLGYEWNKMRHPLFLGVGASYESSNKNTALSGWTLWAKTGISW